MGFLVAVVFGLPFFLLCVAGYVANVGKDAER
jgi:hypothetical protein